MRSLFLALAVLPGLSSAFTEKDFYFDKKTAPYKKIIIDGVNMVQRDNKACRIDDPSSAYISGTKGTKSDPVFYVSCAEGYNVFFSKSEVLSGTKKEKIAYPDRSYAIKVCKEMTLDAVRHPSTVIFSDLLDMSVFNHPNGRTFVTTSFTAKNSYGLEINSEVRCTFEGKRFIDLGITEKKK